MLLLYTNEMKQTPDIKKNTETMELWDFLKDVKMENRNSHLMFHDVT